MTGSSPFFPGDVILDKYRVESVLGSGGMGVVLSATHLRLGGSVALKLLLPELVENPQTVERFIREGRAASRITSEHVARIFDVELLDDGSPMLVMEHLHGRDLAQELRARGPLPLAEVAPWLLQACEAIAEAHRLGLVHRDLKPANLFLTRRADGSALIKVMDFGIAKALDDEAYPSLTSSQEIIGSPLYMSPEQLRSSRDVDARTDIWGLGVLLYELLSNTLPFEGPSSSAVLAAIAADPPRPVQSAIPSAPASVRAILMRALQKAPEDRHQDIAEFAAELGALVPEYDRASVDRIHRILHWTASPDAAPSSDPPDTSIGTALLSDAEPSATVTASTTLSSASSSDEGSSQLEDSVGLPERKGWRPWALAFGGALLLSLAWWVRPAQHNSSATQPAGSAASPEEQSAPSGSVKEPVSSATPPEKSHRAKDTESARPAPVPRSMTGAAPAMRTNEPPAPRPLRKTEASTPVSTGPLKDDTSERGDEKDAAPPFQREEAPDTGDLSDLLGPATEHRK